MHWGGWRGPVRLLVPPWSSTVQYPNVIRPLLLGNVGRSHGGPEMGKKTISGWLVTSTNMEVDGQQRGYLCL
jgi:hypothetical protein